MLEYSICCGCFIRDPISELAPGNGARFTKEVMTWFPNFPNLSSVKKLGLGILETGDGLLSVSFTFVFLFLIVLIILAFL